MRIRFAAGEQRLGQRHAREGDQVQVEMTELHKYRLSFSIRNNDLFF